MTGVADRMTATVDDRELPDLDQYRSYLKLLADLQLNPRLKVKEDASDIVQQTMLEAHRDFAGFRGRTEAELRAWLKMILTHNLLTVAKHYGTDKRIIDREVSMQDQLEQSSALLHCQLVAEQSSPSMKLMKQERSEQLAEALLKLLDDERSAVVLKHFHIPWRRSLSTSAGLRKPAPRAKNGDAASPRRRVYGRRHARELLNFHSSGRWRGCAACQAIRELFARSPGLFVAVKRLEDVYQSGSQFGRWDVA